MALNLVVDANILFSALLKDSKTASLLFNENLKLYTAEFIIDEFLKYQEEIQRRMSRSEKEYIQILHVLQEIITIIPREEYSQFMDRAKEISPDEKDTLYFALALKLHCAIWSNDKQLKRQDVVTIYSTSELIGMV